MTVAMTVTTTEMTKLKNIHSAPPKYLLTGLFINPNQRGYLLTGIFTNLTQREYFLIDLVYLGDP